MLFINNLKNHNATRIQPVSLYQEHLQIIHTHDHCICVYFDKKSIFIYNSIHKNNLTEEQKVIIRALFIYVDKLSIEFSRVLQQPNFKDCAIYAMAYATSIFFHGDPEKITYDI